MFGGRLIYLILRKEFSPDCCYYLYFNLSNLVIFPKQLKQSIRIDRRFSRPEFVQPFPDHLERLAKLIALQAFFLIQALI